MQLLKTNKQTNRLSLLGEGNSDSGYSSCGIRFGHPWFIYTGAVNRAVRQCTQNSQCTTVCQSKGQPGFCENGYCNLWHGTAVAGAIGHSFGVLSPRHAPRVKIYNANDDGSHENQLGWLTGNSVFIENESFGGDFTDIYAQDYFTTLGGMTITEISGNDDADGHGADCPASCHAANTICVAGYNSLANHTMLEKSCTANRANCSVWTTGCDREEPHVVFRGENFETTSNNPSALNGLTYASGTSFAAPGAAGFAALLFHRWGGVFWAKPWAVRAAMMASADKNILGTTYSDYRYPDERDGAGVPSALRVQSMMTQNRVTSTTLYKASSFDANHKRIMGQVSVQAGQRIRAVLSWIGCPRDISDPTANGASVDLDLHVLDPSGNNVGNAASYDGTYEITEVVAATTGTYKFEAQYFGWETCSLMSNYTQAGFAYDVR